jgi:hypothetical protein
MAEHPNATLVRDALAAFNRGEFEQFAALLADDVKWYAVGESEPIRGKAAITSSMGAGGRDFEIKADVHAVLANDDHVVALVNAVGTRGGATLNYRTAEILHMRDGKITDRWSFADDTQAVTKFFG